MRSKLVPLNLMQSIVRYAKTTMRPSTPATVDRFFSTCSKDTSARHPTPIRVYNTITKSIEPFTLIHPNVVHWYMCGPTVYDDTHMGHASCYVKFDIVRRIMENFFGLDVVLLLGITDVDDKIIRRSDELKTDFGQLALKYEQDFFSDMRALRVKPPSMAYRVTDSIGEIIAFVSNLLETGFAYVTEDGSVYFDVARYGPYRYGKLRSVGTVEEDDASTSSTRSHKRSSADFALWKSAAKDTTEPGWPSPWCAKGRPGWHIECSAMASRAFGDRLDLHSGGVDLQFPHHENELAQSCAHHSVDRWVNYWMHSGHMRIRGEKMSKSLGNAVTVRDFLERHTSDEFRIACLMSHYNKSVEYAESLFEEPRIILRRLESFVGLAEAYAQGRTTRSSLDELVILRRLDECKAIMREALANDFNTRAAFDALMALVTFANRQLLQGLGVQADTNSSVSRCPAAMALVVRHVRQFMDSVGISLCDDLDGLATDGAQSDLTNWQSAMDEVVDFRKKIRGIALEGKNDTAAEKVLKERLLVCCDRFRESLSAVGFEIKDQRKDSFWIHTKSRLR